MPPKVRPSFESDIPEHLLSQAAPQEKWLMVHVSKLTQQTSYLMDEQDKQSAQLGEIEAQVRHTNGTVKEHTGQLVPLVEATKDIIDLVATKRFVERIATSKWTWVGCGIFLIGAMRVVTDPTWRTALLQIVGLG